MSALAPAALLTCSHVLKLTTKTCVYLAMLVLQVVKVAGVSLWALFREKKEKPRN